MANKKTNKKTKSTKVKYVENDKPEAVMTDGKVISLKPMPPKKQLLNAVTVIAHRLVGTDHGDAAPLSLGNRTLSQLVGDLRQQDFLTRKEAITLNKRYGLGLIL